MNEKTLTGVKLLGLTGILGAVLGFVTLAHSESECKCGTGTCANCNLQKAAPAGNKQLRMKPRAVPAEASENPTRFELPGSRHKAKKK